MPFVGWTCQQKLTSGKNCLLKVGNGTKYVWALAARNRYILAVNHHEVAAIGLHVFAHGCKVHKVRLMYPQKTVPTQQAIKLFERFSDEQFTAIGKVEHRVVHLN